MKENKKAGLYQNEGRKPQRRTLYRRIAALEAALAHAQGQRNLTPMDTIVANTVDLFHDWQRVHGAAPVARRSLR